MSDDPEMFDPAGRLLAETRTGDNAAPLTVTELSLSLKRTVEDRFGHVRLRGEISGFKRPASGHAYLCLKDADAVIDGVMWKGQVQRLAFTPEDGIEVIVTGKVTTYPGRSKYQIVIERMELAGEGALMQLLDRLRRKLAAEGLFDAETKRSIPFLPRTIGVVTSPTGAVIRDILHRLADRCPTHVLVWPVRVQGEGAAAEIAAALGGFDALSSEGPIPRPDLVIVARGGGSIEDLWAFNEEIVVRAVAACAIPTISAVGHETDTSLCDFAADRRAPTPTAAAEMAVPVRADLLHHLSGQGLRMERCVRRQMDLRRERLEQAARRLPGPDALIGAQRQRMDELAARLVRGLRHRLGAAARELAEASGALRPALLQRRIERERHRFLAVRLNPELVRRPIRERRSALDGLWRLALSLDPHRPLEKGYALVNGGTVRSAAAARTAGALTLTFADGPVEAAVGTPARPARPSGPRPGQRPGQQDLFS